MHLLLSTGTRCTLSALTPKVSNRQRLIIVCVGSASVLLLLHS